MLLSCPSICYENAGRLSKRAAGFGFGDKSDFTKTLTSSPPVTKYNPEEIMLSTKRSSPSKTFGINRDVEFRLFSYVLRMEQWQKEFWNIQGLELMKLIQNHQIIFPIL